MHSSRTLQTNHVQLQGVQQGTCTYTLGNFKDMMSKKLMAGTTAQPEAAKFLVFAYKEFD